MRTELPAGKIITSYIADMSITHTRLQLGLLFSCLVFLFVLPFFATEFIYSFVVTLCITLIAVLGLNIQTGYCGQINIGQAAFMAVGAYTSAILSTMIGLPFFVCLICAGISAGFVGIVFGLPAARIKGLYLAMSTVAAQVLIMWTILQFPGITGGVRGVRTSRPIILGIDFKSEIAWYYLVVSITIIMTWLAKNMMRTKTGRAFIAIRDNDLAAEIGGINIWRYKVLAFFIGCCFAGIAGSLWAHTHLIAHSEPFNFILSVWLLGMVIIGGIGSIAGSIFGVIFLKSIEVGITLLNEFMVAHGLLTFAGAANLAIQGSVIILFLIFEPRGLYHSWLIFRNSYRLWPFRY